MDAQLSIALLGGIMPALVMGVGVLLAWGLLDTEDTHEGRRPRWAAPLLLALVLLMASAAGGRFDGDLWPRAIAGRTLAYGLIGAALGLLSAVCPLAWATRVARLLALGFVSWSVLSGGHLDQLTGARLWALVVVTSLLAAAAIECFERAPRRAGWLAPAQLAAITLAGSAVVYFSSMSIGAQQTGGVGASLVAGAGAALLLRRAELPRGLTDAVVVFLVGVCLVAHRYGWAELDAKPALPYLFLFAGVPLAGLGRWVATRTGPRLLGVTAALAITLAPPALGVLFAWRTYEAQNAQNEDTDADDAAEYYRQFQSGP